MIMNRVLNGVERVTKYKMTRLKGFCRDKLFDFKCRCQRFKRGYAWTDVWNIDTWFKETIKPMLEHLIKHHAGYPGYMSNEEWESVLQEMVDCLNLMDEEAAEEKLKMEYGYENYSEFDFKEVDKLMNENKDKFFKLFSEHFYALWD